MSIPHALLLTLLLGLGTARMAAIISIDKISDPLRDLIFHWSPPEDSDADGWFYQGMRPATEEEQLRMGDWDVPWWQKRWTSLTPADIEAGYKERKPGFLGMLVGCHRCTSVWIAFGNLALYWIWRDAAIVLNVGCAASFVASASDTHFYKR